MKSRIVFEILTIGVIVCLIIWNVRLTNKVDVLVADSDALAECVLLNSQGGLYLGLAMQEMQAQIDSLKTITAGYGEISLYAYAMAKKGRK